MRRLRCKYIVVVLLISMIVVDSGCSRSKKKKVVLGQVSGKAMLDGEPLAGGCSVHFVANFDSGTAIVAAIGEGGSFKLIHPDYKGVPVGDYRIRVLPPHRDPVEAEKEGREQLAQMINAMQKGQRNIPAPRSTMHDVVPDRYWSETTSNLTFTVKEGENTVDLALQRSKK